jgi:hypothetical protein
VAVGQYLFRWTGWSQAAAEERKKSVYTTIYQQDHTKQHLFRAKKPLSSATRVTSPIYGEDIRVGISMATTTPAQK